MVDRNDFIRVRCGNCDEEFEEQIGRLQQTGAFRHGCGAYVECNLNELDRFVRDEIANELARLPLHVLP